MPLLLLLASSCFTPCNPFCIHFTEQTGTDYGPYLANEASPMHTTTLVDCCTRKLVADWKYMRENVRTG
jgi:hypothetical protein